MKPQIKAIYICIKNMDRAIKFYEEIFDKKVSSYDKRMSSFEFDNLSFLLFDPKMDNEEVVYGNNVIPNVEVDDINKMMDFIRKKECKIIMPLQQIGRYLIFQIEDIEGNIVEFYQLTT